MTTKQAEYIIQQLAGRGVQFESGLTTDEVLQVETKFNCRFPPDLKLFLRTALPVSDKFINWRLGLQSQQETDKINGYLSWPLEGMLFDLESNDFWINSWGDKPATIKEKERIAKEKFLSSPKLIPVFSHRYIPSRPEEEGNPVFSVFQMDIIYYGYDLASYFASEFKFALTNDFEQPDKPKNVIEFWSEWAEE